VSYIDSNKELFIEFKENSMHVLEGESGVDIPLERDAAGRVSPASIELAAGQLHAFLQAQGVTAPAVANCSIPARGVSVRRISLPNAAQSELERLLTFQLEAQMPVPPNELAWGCARLNSKGSAELQEFLVIAVKRELLSDYTAILARGGAAAQYTLGAVARRPLCGDTTDSFSILESGGTKGELAIFDPRGVLSVRVLSLGDGALNGALPTQPGQKLYLTGPGQQNIAKKLTETQPTAAVEILDGFGGPGKTAANVGFKRLIESGAEPLLLGAHEATPAAPAAAPQWKWVAIAALLVLMALSLRYAEALIFRARLSNKLAALASYRATLPKIEREFNFLNYIKTNQPPYLDTLTLLALSAPPGTKIENISMVRHSDLSVRGSTGNAEGPGALRSKLIDSGFFSRVVVDEQAPSSDGQKVTFRLSAQVRPDYLRRPVSLATKPVATNATVEAASKGKK
jgi:hypothetical protein